MNDQAEQNTNKLTRKDLWARLHWQASERRCFPRRNCGLWGEAGSAKEATVAEFGVATHRWQFRSVEARRNSRIALAAIAS